MTQMTPEDEHAFYADPANPVPQGPPVRRRAALGNPVPVRLPDDTLARVREAAQADATSLAKAELTSNGGITCAALRLLGTRHARIVVSEHVARLRAAELVESRKPHLRVFQDIAKLTGKMPHNLRKKPQADAHYAKLVLDP